MHEVSSREIINSFLDFFTKNGHLKIDNSSIIPKNDPTLLFINSGMAAIKNYFTGKEKPVNPEICNVQTCIRTIDIDEVGDRHHLTSFHMLGNWSINGRYFKNGAIGLAFEFITKNLGIPIEKLYVSVFAGNKELGLEFDDESKKTWIELGINKNRVLSFGMDDNFWGPTGETGPCGPCTEVFYDTGVGADYQGSGDFDTKRYIEIWNAGVFMMLNKTENLDFVSLPFKSVDAGAGLERFAMVIGGHDSVYETDLLSPIKFQIEALFNVRNLPQNMEEVFEKNMRILTDHLRTTVLILASKIRPANESRGYIPRKLIRKCIAISQKTSNFCGMTYSPNLLPVVEFILDNFNDIYPDFITNKKFVLDQFNLEVTKFESVVQDGLEKLLEHKNKLNLEISGDFAFDLVTTFGLPFEIIRDFALENNLKLDGEKYNKNLENHRNISKFVDKSERSIDEVLEKIYSKIPPDNETNFVGYDNEVVTAKIYKIFSDTGEEICNISNQKKVFLIFNNTTLYAKAGGQDYDKGIIFSYDYITLADITGCFKKNGVYVHCCEMRCGNLSVGDSITIGLDFSRRKKLSRAHSATHLLHSVLRKMFGNELEQHGSKVDENKLRFDFNYDGNISRENILGIEKEVNKYILKNLKCEIKIMQLSQAINYGATAIFTGKYDDIVRVVVFKNDEFVDCADIVSKELCGGTHVEFSSQIGFFVIESVENIGKGIRRITAFVGEKAVEFYQNKISILYDSTKILGSSYDDFVQKLSKKVAVPDVRVKKYTKNLENSDLVYADCDIPLAYKKINERPSVQALTKLAEQIKGVIAVITDDGSVETKSYVSLAVASHLNLNAGKILKQVLSGFDQKGGGNSVNAYGNFGKINVAEFIGKIVELIQKKI
ncbi:MAG: alanine--tRNA ligase [Candidatus Improbicoccus devescovinae]|nr:MAG: alanine--tRNA ligase [Candidatus Improbicoccus devescovinae]